MWSFTTTSSNLYVFNSDGFGVYSFTGTLERQLPMPSNLQGTRQDGLSGPIVDSDGDVYLASYYGNFVDAIAPDGTLRWTKTISGPRIFPLDIPSGAFEMGVSNVQSSTSSIVLDSTGAQIGTIPLVQQGPVSVTPSGNLLMTTGSYIQTWSGDGTKELGQFGSAAGTNGHTGGAFAIAPLSGQSVQASDGTIYTTDPLSVIAATNPSGILQGEANFGSTNVFTSIAIEGSQVFFGSGPAFDPLHDRVDEISLQALQTYIDGPHAPLNTLGWGADIKVGAAANYFSPGTAPTASASFDSWWSGLAAHLSLNYAVRSASDIAGGESPSGATIALPTDPTSLSDIDLPIAGDASTPGPYQLAVSLQDNTTSPPTTIARTCVPFTVGAPGDALDLSQLPESPGAGGPPDQRGVLLNGQLGLNGFRGGLSLSTFLPDCSPSAPTAAGCSASAITFASAPEEPFQAAYDAGPAGVTYWVQLSGGDSISNALVSNGWWQADVESIVAHYSVVPSGCGHCAPVTNWEPWNEPNNTGWPNGGTYTSQVLAPFYRAVKAANPSAKVIGGSTLGVATGWWNQLIAAGGLQYMDVVGVHPYSGSNDSWEEDGIPAALKTLQSLVAPKPVWITEVAWWSDGDYNYLHQADAIASAMLWQAGLNIPVWGYFFDEGSWGNNGLSFSLIQTDGGDDYVKPAALAVMTAHSEIAARPVVQAATLQDPAVYVERFGPRPGGSHDLIAAWSDELDTTELVTASAPGGGSVPVTVTDEYGHSQAVSVPSGHTESLPVSAEVTYLSYPSTDSLTLTPVEPYGPDLGAGAAGAKATASSGDGSSALGDPAGASYSGQGWTSGSGDTQPSLTVTLAGPATVNRIVVDTGSVGSTAPGVRDYTVEVEDPQGSWSAVAAVQDQFAAHQKEIWISPQEVTAVRVTVSEVNYGGYYGGAIPVFWPAGDWEGAFLHSVQIYGGTAAPSAVSAYQPLAGGSDQTGPSSPSGASSAPSGGSSSSTSSLTSTGGGSSSSGAGSLPSGGGASSPPASGGSSGAASPPPPASGGSSSDPGGASSSSSTSSPPPAPTPSAPRTVSHPLPVGGDRLVAASSNSGATWLVTARGAVYTSGTASWWGDPSKYKLTQPIVGVAPTPDGRGYWLVAADGGVFSYGDARYYGSLGGIRLNAPIVGIASTPTGKGYWLVGSDGGVFAFGDAKFFGSTGNLRLDAPIVTVLASSDGEGYRLIGSDGGVFSFGNARFFGSTGGVRLAQPIVAAVSRPQGDGYWLVARDGGIFAFGGAAFHGSAVSEQASNPVIGLVPLGGGAGYTVYAASGTAHTFGAS